jgi:hypothetical protein
MGIYSTASPTNLFSVVPKNQAFVGILRKVFPIAAPSTNTQHTHTIHIYHLTFWKQWEENKLVNINQLHFCRDGRMLKIMPH